MGEHTRFWSKVDMTGECWVWTARRKPTGYGEFGYNGRKQRAHRVAWLLTHGVIPDGLNVLHRCDNPPCVNPAHLFLGTQLENIRDRDLKGRGAWKANPARRSIVRRPRLTPEQLTTIRAEWSAGSSQADLARRFDRARSQIHNIVRGKQWQSPS